MLLSGLKGLGPKRRELLEQYNIRTSDDLIRFWPLDYADNSRTVTITEAEPGKQAALRLKIVSGPSFFTRNGMTVITFYGSDGTKKIPLRWFNQPFRARSLSVGDERIFNGLITEKNGKNRAMVNPTVYTELTGITPVYAPVKGLPGKLIRGWIGTVLEKEPPAETLPERVLRNNGLPGMAEAVRTVHFPNDRESLEKAWERIRFENALLFFLYLEDTRRPGAVPTGMSFDTKGAEKAYADSLPYPLTKGQKAAIRDISKDMSATYPMNRLIEGDVGCGKTAVAEYAVFVAHRSGRQSVFMAPTELLAKQQYTQLSKRFGNACGFFSGSLSASQRREALAHMRDGSWSVIAGTHALFSEDVTYKDLGLIVTDEQHRFGVRQRALISRKGQQPDVLVMSATPIPRTLALMLYGDLQVSMIRDMPAGRTPIKTYLIGKNKREDMYRYLEKEAAEGRKSYIVCPLIEQAEDSDLPAAEAVYEELKTLLPKASLALVHGRMKEEEKQTVMTGFRNGTYTMLVSTTVIEVGIDIKDAVHMVIEGADRFGLSSLHQLRGRVGRGSIPGHCYLSVTSPNETALARLQVLLDTTDGFEVAEKDMALRGAGDILGLRQSGESSTSALLQECGPDVLMRARETAVDMLTHMTGENLELLQRAHDRYRNGSVVFN